MRDRVNTDRRIDRLLAVAMAVALIVPIAAAHATTARPHVAIQGDSVRLGDIFTDAGPSADIILFPAPAPGKRVILNARWLYRAARAYDLDWTPKAGMAPVIVKRAGNRVPPEAIQETLRRSLVPHLGPNGIFEIEIDNKALQIHVRQDMPATVTVSSLRYDAGSRRFAADLVAPDMRPNAMRVAVSGRVHRVIEVPVPVRRIHRGGVIRTGDLRLQRMRASRIDRAALTDLRDIVGKSPRRVLAMDRPVRAGDVREPVLVPKRGMVTMVFRSANMVITARGKAREAGARGETVRVVNTSSGKTVEAVVTGPDRVEVLAPGLLAAR
jgi:flagella basal body P-ring formation protein FlgA